MPQVMVDFFPTDMSAHWQEPDFLLADLVSFMANRLGTELGVTLMLRGSVVTGSLVGERQYLSEVNRLFKTMARQSLDNPSEEELASIEEAFNFDELTEDEYLDDDDDPDDMDDLDDDSFEDGPMPIRHLHLKNPVLLYPGASVSFTDSPLPIMRIRLTAIDGWMLGRITVIDGSEDDLPNGGMLQ
ncbi:MAG: hypothetical protein GYB67_01125 [Chloroflexi bacterium]|nr:hypothetical protein [Chloroflexota bacterium]